MSAYQNGFDFIMNISNTNGIDNAIQQGKQFVDYAENEEHYLTYNSTEHYDFFRGVKMATVVLSIQTQFNFTTQYILTMLGLGDFVIKQMAKEVF